MKLRISRRPSSMASVQTHSWKSVSTAKLEAGPSIPNPGPMQCTLASTAEKAVAVVEIYAGNAEGTPGLFASGGAVGQSETGPWVRPGSVFSLRDKATGSELEKLVIGGPVCP